MKEKVFVLTRRGKERAGGAMTSVSFIDLTDTLNHQQPVYVVVLAAGETVPFPFTRVTGKVWDGK